jgi:serine/threonine-protein kinase
MDRRNFIKIAGVAGAVGVTGCTGGGGDGDGGDGDGGGDGGDGGGNGGSDTTAGQDGTLDADLTGQDEVNVDVGAGPSGYKFDPADIRIDPGTTVVWTWTGRGSQHNVVESDGTEILDDPSFEPETRIV